MLGPPFAGNLQRGGRLIAANITVHLSTHFRSYTGGKASVPAEGRTAGEALDDLNRRYPGLKFRAIDEQGCIRRHVRLFVNEEEISGLEAPLKEGDELHVLAALSGG